MFKNDSIVTEIELLTVEFLFASLLFFCHVTGLGVVGRAWRGAGSTGGVKVPPGLGGAMGGEF